MNPANPWIRRAPMGMDVLALTLLVLGSSTVVSIPFSLGATPQGSALPVPDFAFLAAPTLETQLQDLQTHALFYIPPPPPPKPEGPLPADAVLQNYRVIGIVQGARPGAVLEEMPKKETHVVEPGSAFNGIRVVNVLSKSVLLDFQGHQKMLPLRDAA